MFVIDQIGVRLGVGLIMVGVVAGLEKMEALSYGDNMFVNCLCEEELVALKIQREKQKASIQLREVTSPTKKHSKSPPLMRIEIPKEKN